MLSGPPLEAWQDPLLLPDRPVAVYRTRDKFKFLLLLSKGFELCFFHLSCLGSPCILLGQATLTFIVKEESSCLSLPAPTYAESFTPRIGKGIMVNLIVCAQAVSVSFSG